MQKVGVANLPLHDGKCPRWLFDKMVNLSGAISDAIILEYGKREFVRRLADPFWFQSLGCALGFDWHSSGLTTTTLGALKVSINEKDHGIGICGGKGKASNRIPEEIQKIGDNFLLPTKTIKEMKYASRMSAKVDTAAIQDGYNLYHHSFILTDDGDWAVVQQGLNPENRYARRYHWLSDNIIDFILEPHSGIASEKMHTNVLDMTSRQSEEARKISVDLVKENPIKIEKFFNSQTKLFDFLGGQQLNMPRHHYIKSLSKHSIETLRKAYEIQPRNYEHLLSLDGMGPATIRALALVSEIVYGKPPSWQDPAKFSFAHGGKDGIPYTVNRKDYENSVSMLKQAIENANVGEKDKLNALRRLAVVAGGK